MFLFFGLVAVNGSYYVQLERLDWLPFGLSLAVGFLATAILVVNNVRDLETDRRAGKMTLAVRLGRQRTRSLYALLIAAAFVAVPRHPARRGRARLGPAGAARGAAGPAPARRRDDADGRALAERGPGGHRRPAGRLQRPARRRPV